MNSSGLRTTIQRTLSLRLAFCYAVTVMALASTLPAQNSRVFHGEISDSQCALNVHSLTRSHQEMLKSKSMGGTSNTCSVYCIERLGGYLVLSAGNDVYRLMFRHSAWFEGRKVVITGVLDPKLKQIHVVKIDLDENQPPRASVTRNTARIAISAQSGPGKWTGKHDVLPPDKQHQPEQQPRARYPGVLPGSSQNMSTDEARNNEFFTSFFHHGHVVFGGPPQ